jgi:acetyl-CoA carboxylase biotin carboxyl carrier protein
MFEEMVEHRLKPIAAAFAESDLVRIRVADEATEIELRRSAPAVRTSAEAAKGGEQAKRPYDLISAEVVGIIRLARPAVEEGATLAADRELGYVEALGIRNPVRSRGAGRVACVYVADGEPVDFGQPLFAIDRG